MRDIAVTLVVLGSLPFIVRRPWIGILVWTWLGFMNPHRLAWGFATTMPFAAIVALTTMVAVLISREPKKLNWTPELVLILVFLAWMVVTSLDALYPTRAWPQFSKVSKIFLMIFVAAVVINTKERLLALVWVIALSIGFYGVKGGVFTLVTGGGFRVQGPEGTFIGGNNEIGLALCMTIPLLYYLSQIARRPWIRYSLIGAAVMTVIAALGTQSRGALLGLSLMGGLIWLKSRRKFQIAILIAFAVLVLVPFMPESWFQRMSTIENFEHDKSALSRLAAWRMAINLASSRFLGGGFEAFQAPTFERYAPDEALGADAHSIYFEVLGEHGYVGLMIFLALVFTTWVSASKVMRACKRSAERRWLHDLMAMTQVSLAAYLGAGAFLGMAYFDYFYNLVLVVLVAKGILAPELVAKPDVVAGVAGPRLSAAGENGPPPNPSARAAGRNDNMMPPMRR
jgi:probable O-glycosylation ligase (exosortase A-associated)